MSGKPWRLPRQAEAVLTDIAKWMPHTFGPGQANLYADSLIQRCTAITSGERASRAGRAVIDLALPEDLRLVRSGQHLIVFVEDTDHVVIVDFLHIRSDLPARIGRLLDDRSDD